MYLVNTSNISTLSASFDGVNLLTTTLREKNEDKIRATRDFFAGEGNA